MVAVGVGPDTSDYEILALSVPDARQLITLLHDAVDRSHVGALTSGLGG